MSAKLLDGRVVASRLWRDLSDRVAQLTERTGVQPRLAILRFEEQGPSAVYAASLSHHQLIARVGRAGLAVRGAGAGRQDRGGS